MPLSWENSQRYSCPRRGCRSGWCGRDRARPPAPPAGTARHGGTWCPRTPGGVGVRVDMDHADGPSAPQRLEDRQRDRMVAADSERGDARLREQREMRLDVLVAALQRVARAEGHVADVRDLEVDQRRGAQHMVHRPDALHGAHGAGAESRASAVGDAEVHRHAADRHVEPADVRQSGRVRPVGRAAEGGDVGEGPFAPLALELPCGHAREGRIGDVAAAGVGELPAQALSSFVWSKAGLRFRCATLIAGLGKGQASRACPPKVVCGKRPQRAR